MTLDARFIQRSRPGAWAADAACRDVSPSVFFASHGGFKTKQSNLKAKAICATCPSRLDCLQHALEQNETEGVWGGLTPEERRGIRRFRKVECANCGESFVPADTGAFRLCSDECRAAAHREAKRRYKERVTA